jgi:hypothetical protein
MVAKKVDYFIEIISVGSIVQMFSAGLAHSNKALVVGSTGLLGSCWPKPQAKSFNTVGAQRWV